MAMFVPPVIGGVVAGTAAYQAWNPPKKQAPESKNAPRNGQDWRLGPTTDNMKIPDYWVQVFARMSLILPAAQSHQPAHPTCRGRLQEHL